MNLIGCVWIQILFQILCPSELNFSKAITEIPRKCPNSTSLFVRNRCYWSIGEGNFLQSQRRCVEQGGLLAEIPDETVENRVNTKFRVEVKWIGIHDMHVEGEYKNMLNKTVNYTHWRAGNSRAAEFEDCVMLTDTGWLESDCSMSTVAICSEKLQEPFERRPKSTFQSKAPQSTTYRTKTRASTNSWSTKENSTFLTATTTSESLRSTASHLRTSLSTAFRLMTSTSTTPKSTTTRMPQDTALFISQSTTPLTSSTPPLTSSTPPLTSSTPPLTSSTTQSTSSSTQSTTPKLTTFHLTPLQEIESNSTTTKLTRLYSTFLHAVSPITKQRGCLCPCGRTQNVIIENEAELKIKVETLKKALSIDKSILSRSIRQRTSVLDARPSVYIVGGTLCFVAVLVLGLIVFSDVRRLCCDVKRGRCRHFKMSVKKDKAKKKERRRNQIRNEVLVCSWIKMEDFTNRKIILSFDPI